MFIAKICYIERYILTLEKYLLWRIFCDTFHKIRFRESIFLRNACSMLYKNNTIISTSSARDKQDLLFKSFHYKNMLRQDEAL